MPSMRKGHASEHDCVGINLMCGNRRDGCNRHCEAGARARYDPAFHRQERNVDRGRDSRGARAWAVRSGTRIKSPDASSRSRPTDLDNCDCDADPWLGATSSNDRLVAGAKANDPSILRRGHFRLRPGFDLPDSLTSPRHPIWPKRRIDERISRRLWTALPEKFSPAQIAVYKNRAAHQNARRSVPAGHEDRKIGRTPPPRLRQNPRQRREGRRNRPGPRPRS